MTRRLSTKYMMESLFGPEIVLSGRRFINFGGCGYLGLHNRAEIIQAGCEAFQKYGISSGIGRHYDVSNDPRNRSQLSSIIRLSSRTGGGYSFGHDAKTCSERGSVVQVNLPARPVGPTDL